MYMMSFFKIPKTVSQVERRKGESHFWSRLMEIKKLVLVRGRFQVQDGSNTRFWEDLWLGKETLIIKYSTLYIVRKKNVSVAQVLSTTPLNVPFRRALVGDNWDKWIQLVESVLSVHLNDHMDSFRWTDSKKILVKNMYNDLVLKGIWSTVGHEKPRSL
jgi:hypothetical protein